MCQLVRNLSVGRWFCRLQIIIRRWYVRVVCFSTCFRSNSAPHGGQVSLNEALKRASWLKNKVHEMCTVTDCASRHHLPAHKYSILYQAVFLRARWPAHSRRLFRMERGALPSPWMQSSWALFLLPSVSCYKRSVAAANAFGDHGLFVSPAMKSWAGLFPVDTQRLHDPFPPASALRSSFSIWCSITRRVAWTKSWAHF